jgi:putative oxidoreductase
LKLLSSAASLVEQRTPVKYAVLAGRQLFSAIFIIASARHFSPQTIDAAAGHGVPLPGLLVPLSGIIALLGGLSILFGFHTRLGAGLLVIFLVPVTLAMHNFWSVSDPMTHQIEIAMFEERHDARRCTGDQLLRRRSVEPGCSPFTKKGLFS